jgi:hypothetical protein
MGYTHGSRGAHRLPWYRPGPVDRQLVTTAPPPVTSTNRILTEDGAFLMTEDGAFLVQET